MVQLALGDAVRADHPQVEKFVLTTHAEPVQTTGESVLVLSLGEVAARLGIGRAEVERMIASGKLKALMAGWTAVVQTSEVERLRASG